MNEKAPRNLALSAQPVSDHNFRTVAAFKQALADNLYYTRGQAAPTATPKDVYAALAYTVRDYLVEIGGEVRARGQSPAGRAWRVAVEVPLAGERKPYTLVELDGRAVSTSGDYRDFRIVDGHRVSHTIDPRTGAPVTHGLASVCVVHPSAAYADAYATALMVLGPEEGLATASRLGLAVLLIERAGDGKDFTERTTPAFDRLRRDVD